LRNSVGSICFVTQNTADRHNMDCYGPYSERLNQSRFNWSPARVAMDSLPLYVILENILAETPSQFFSFINICLKIRNAR